MRAEVKREVPSTSIQQNFSGFLENSSGPTLFISNSIAITQARRGLFPKLYKFVLVDMSASIFIQYEERCFKLHMVKGEA